MPSKIFFFQKQVYQIIYEKYIHSVQYCVFIDKLSNVSTDLNEIINNVFKWIIGHKSENQK